MTKQQSKTKLYTEPLLHTGQNVKLKWEGGSKIFFLTKKKQERVVQNKFQNTITRSERTYIVATETSSATSKREHWERHWDRNIDSDLKNYADFN